MSEPMTGKDYREMEQARQRMTRGEAVATIRAFRAELQKNLAELRAMEEEARRAEARAQAEGAAAN